MGRSFAAASEFCTVLQVHNAVLETSFIEQFEVDANMCGEPVVAASNDDRCDELDDLIHQPGSDRLAGEVGAAHADVTLRASFQLPDVVRVEVALHMRFGGGHLLKC